MRRLLMAGLALATSAGMALTSPATAGPATVPHPAAASPRSPALPAPASERAQLALHRARALIEGSRPVPPGLSATLARRDLFAARPRLTGAARAEAERLMSRPFLSGPERRLCNTRLCVHYAASGVDAPPSKDWVLKNLSILNRVWKKEVGDLGYRKPIADPGGAAYGGNRKFDVYLQDLGSQGLYGYCQPEGSYTEQPKGAFAHCALDNDFSRAEFPSHGPTGNLKVTAAHEFFHAIQFGYDVEEAGWLMESTSTWMEERFADDVNDNRNYLPASQIPSPGSPLDLAAGPYWYAHWIFWEFFTQRRGNAVVQRVWDAAGTYQGRDLDADEALTEVLGQGPTGFRRRFAQYAAGTTTPGASWREGRRFGVQPAVAGPVTLTRSFRKGGPVTEQLDHLTLASTRFRPGDDLAERGWRLRVRVDMFARRRGSAVTLTLHKRPGLERVVVPLSGAGNGTVEVPFRAGAIRSVTVTAVNGSVEPADDGLSGTFTVRAFRR